MKTVLVAGFALIGLPASALAQGEPGAAPASPTASAACYVEVAKLMTDPPAGIGELGAAIRELDVKLRPQYEEVNALKAEIARLEARQSQGPGIQPASSEAAAEGFGDESPRPASVAAPSGPDPTAERLTQALTELEAKQNQL